MDSYLSGELLVESNHQVLRHVEACGACRSEVERRERTRTLLRQSFDIPLDVEALQGRISKALAGQRARWSSVARYGAVAATVALGVIFTMWYPRPIDAAAYADSADNHVLCALTVPASAVYDPKRAARRLEPPFAEIVQTVRHSHGGYDLVDAHMCPYQGRKYVHLVYRGHGQMLSVFAEEALRGALPQSDAAKPMQTPSPEVFSSRAQNGYWVTGTATRRHHVFAVSNDSPSTPADVANILLNSAVQFVRTLER
jgi:anti-sigma factor RsiW